jgi:hypothetical protein
MRELEQRRATAAEKHRQIATDLPRDRARAENAGTGIVNLFAQDRERGLEIGARHDHRAIVAVAAVGRQVNRARPPQRADQSRWFRRKCAARPWLATAQRLHQAIAV